MSLWLLEVVAVDVHMVYFSKTPRNMLGCMISLCNGMTARRGAQLKDAVKETNQLRLLVVTSSLT